MPTLKCKNCDREFKKKADYWDHINNLESESECAKIINVCTKCGKKSTTNSNNTQHMKTCKKKPTDIIKIKKKINCRYCGKSCNRTYDLMNHYRLCNAEMNEEIIKLVNFGKRDLEHFKESYMPELLIYSDLIIGLVYLTNLNPDTPNLHNVYYFDKTSPNAMVYNDNGWISMKIRKVVADIINFNICQLNDILRKYDNILSDDNKNKIKQNINDALDIIYLRPYLMKCIIELFFENKKVIKKTRELIKIQEIKGIDLDPGRDSESNE